MNRLLLTAAALATLSASSLALAQDGSSRLLITTDRLVAIRVDGAILEYIPNTTNVMAQGLQPGKHAVVMTNVVGNKTFLDVMVDVPQAHEVRCRYAHRERTLDCYESVALEVAPAAAPPSQTVVVVQDPAPRTETTTTETTTVSTGIPGMTTSVTVTESGDSANVNMNMGGFATTGYAESTTTTTTVTGGGIPAVGGTVTVNGPAGGNATVSVGGVGLGMGGVTVTETTTTTTTQPGGAVVVAPAAPPLPSKVKVVVRSLDGEWADVVVDGKVELELRNQDEGFIWVTPGRHTVEIREFMADDPYASGRLETGYAETITLGIKEGKPVTCYDHDGWFGQ